MLVTDLIPAQILASKRLMIVLHGLGDSMEGYRFLPQALNIADLNYLLVNAPDSYYGGHSWYDFAHDPIPGVQRSRKSLTALLDQQRAAGFPSESTFLFGFSQGCLMTLETGLRYDHRLAGLVGISGYVLDVPDLLAGLSPVAKSQRILWTHGSRDPVIPFAGVKQQAEQLRAAGLDIEWREFHKEHTIAGAQEMAVIRAFVEKK